ncbi:hypothetical protein LXL04_037582 [Taraxacum kok-saghyz]
MEQPLGRTIQRSMLLNRLLLFLFNITRIIDAICAIRRQQRCGPILVFSSHNRHSHPWLRRILIFRLICPPQNSFHMVGKSTKLKLNFQMSKAVIRRHIIAMDLVIFRCNWHYICQNLHHSRWSTPSFQVADLVASREKLLELKRRPKAWIQVKGLDLPVGWWPMNRPLIWRLESETRLKCWLTLP